MHPYLLKGLSLGPEVIGRLVKLIPGDQIDTSLSPDRFTVREVVAHLADWEALFRGRMETAFAIPNSPIITFDEGERAIERKYAELDLQEQLSLYGAERAATVRFLSALNPSQFELKYIHPSLGPMTIEDQANMLVGHDMYHVEQLLAYLPA